jgi:hypothetical protein
MRLFDDPLKTIVDGMVQAHGIRQQMLQARMEQARAKMMERDMARREEDSQRSRQMQDIQFQQQMGEAARPVNGGTVEDPNPLPFAAPGMDAPASFPVLRKPDPSRLVKYKRADGQQMQYELLTPEEQQSKGLERLKAEQSAKMQAEEARQLRLRQILGPVELAQKRSELEMQAGFSSSARDAQNTFTAGEKQKDRDAQAAVQKAAAERQKALDAETARHRKEIERIGWTNATRPRGGGGGGGTNDQGLIDAVSANPALFESLTPTVKTRILPSLAAAGVQLPGRPLSGEASKVVGVAQTMLPEVDALMAAMRAPDFRMRMTKVKLGLDPELSRLVDNVADKVGRLRSGGAVNKNEEERFRGQILRWVDIGTGDNSGALQGLQGLRSEAESVLSQMNRGGAAPAGGAPQTKPAAGGGVPTVGGMFNGQKVLKVTRIE